MAMSVTYTNVLGQVLFEDRGGNQTEFIPDPLGNVVKCRNSGISYSYSAEYWPYGEIQTSSGTNPSNFGYVGTWGYYKDSSNQIYVRARYYKPVQARWLTVDPLWPRLPRYKYVRCKPTTHIDRSGLKPQLVGPIGNPDWPEYTFEDGLVDVFRYGHYCGANNYDYRSCRPEPLDCIDAACQKHDDCLKNNAYWSAGGASCHCQLLADALYCSLIGCLQNMDDSWGAGDAVAKCFVAANSVWSIFVGICGASGLVGGLGAIIGGGSNGGGGTVPPRVDNGGIPGAPGGWTVGGGAVYN